MSSQQLFEEQLTKFADTLSDYANNSENQWTIKGFVDVDKNIYTISSDTKVVSKILEIHLFPKILQFASENHYDLILARHQNYYPDITFISQIDTSIRFAVDFKTTYRNPARPGFCNGFTLGSHGEYFVNRQSCKNIQFPYSTYLGHYCLGIIYDRVLSSVTDETTVFPIEQLHSITSVIGNLQFFVAEKWKIASDKSGSGNTANIGSIKNISAILSGNGTFSRLGETWFDDYWMNYGKITVPTPDGGTRTIRNLRDFVLYRNGNTDLIVHWKDGELE